MQKKRGRPIGSKQTQSAKDAIAASRKGKPMSEESKQKMRLTKAKNRAIKQSEKTIAI